MTRLAPSRWSASASDLRPLPLLGVAAGEPGRGAGGLPGQLRARDRRQRLIGTTRETVVASPTACRSARAPRDEHRRLSNWQFAPSQATGRYVVDLSDDDSLLGVQVADMVATMEATWAGRRLRAGAAVRPRRRAGAGPVLHRAAAICASIAGSTPCCSTTSCATTSFRRFTSPDATPSRRRCRGSTSTRSSPSSTRPTT